MNMQDTLSDEDSEHARTSSLFAASGLAHTIAGYSPNDVINSTPIDLQETILRGTASFDDQKYRKKVDDSFESFSKEQSSVEQGETRTIEHSHLKNPHSSGHKSSKHKVKHESKSKSPDGAELKKFMSRRITMGEPAKHETSVDRSTKGASVSVSKFGFDVPSAQDFLSKDRHLKTLKAPKNPSKQESAQVLPSGLSDSKPKKDHGPALEEMTTKIFQLHALLEDVSKLTNDSFEDNKPMEGLSDTRNAFVKQWKGLKSSGNIDEEHVLPEAIKLAKDCDNTLFELRRKIGRMYRSENSSMNQ